MADVSRPPSRSGSSGLEHIEASSKTWFVAFFGEPAQLSSKGVVENGRIRNMNLRSKRTAGNFFPVETAKANLVRGWARDGFVVGRETKILILPDKLEEQGFSNWKQLHQLSCKFDSIPAGLWASGQKGTMHRAAMASFDLWLSPRSAVGGATSPAARLRACFNSSS